MLSCILLSAGFSRRFGSPKALAKMPSHGEILVIQYIQQKLLASQIDEVIIILGAHADQIKSCLLKHKAMKIVYNKDYNFGQTSSFKVGLQNVSSKSKGVMLLPVDYPFVSSATMDTLINHFLKDAPLILIPTFQNQKGHPPLFDIQLKNEFLSLEDSSGLNMVAHYHQKATTLLPVNDAGVIQSFNTKEEFEQLMA